MYLSIRILLLLIFFAPAFVEAQEELTVYSADSISAALYENKQWKRLTLLGEKAVKEGIESSILRIRIGTAYYELGEITDAIPHLRKAVATGYADGITQEDLFEAYLMMGMEADADVLFYEMSDYRKGKLRPLYNDFIYDASSNFSFSFTNDQSINSGIGTHEGSQFTGQQTITGDEFSFSAGLAQLPLRWMKISYEFTYRNISRELQSTSGSVRTTDPYKQKQGHLFNEFTFRADDGLVIKAAGKYVNVNETSPTQTIEENGSFSHTTANYEQDDFVLSLTADKWFSIFKASGSASFSYLNKEHQTQYGVSLTAFPLGNPSLAVSGEGILHNENSVAELIFTPRIGSQLTERLTVTAFGQFGRMYNYNFDNGRSIYNDKDVVTLAYGADARYDFPFNLSFTLGLSGQSRQKEYTTWTQFQKGNSSEFTSNKLKAEYTLLKTEARLAFIF